MSGNWNRKARKTMEFGIQPVSFLKTEVVAVQHDNQAWYISTGHSLACSQWYTT